MKPSQRKTPRSKPDKPKSMQLEFSLEGEPKDRGLVRVRAFVQFLRDTLEALGSLEKGPARPIDYRIIELGIGSATVALEPIAPRDDPKRPAAVQKTFLSAMKAAQKGRLEKVISDPKARAAFERIIRPPKSSGIRSVDIRVDGERFHFAPAGRPQLRLHPPAETLAMGSFAGFLDAVNVHTEPVFYLYPVVGPQRIACVFDRTLIDDVRMALRRYAIVHGLMEYFPGEPFPHRIVVERIESFDEKPRPSIRDLKGIAPNLARGMAAEDYIASVRNETA